jgi:hypothetical protein
MQGVTPIPAPPVPTPTPAPVPPGPSPTPSPVLILKGEASGPISATVTLPRRLLSMPGAKLQVDFDPVSLPISGTAAPESPKARLAFLDFVRLAKDVFAVLESDDAATVESAVLKIVADGKAGDYGAILLDASSSLDALSAVIEHLTAILSEFMSMTPRAAGVEPHGALLDWLKSHEVQILQAIGIILQFIPKQ